MISTNISLKPYNTFGIDVLAKKFASFKDLSELNSILEKRLENEELFILGGGSNVLLTQDVDAFVLKNEIKGMEILSQDEQSVTLKVKNHGVSSLHF